MSIERLCRDCFQTFEQFSTLQNRCGKCSYSRMMALRYKSGAKAKPIKRMGKKAFAWVAERKQWIKDNPPDDYGVWDCYLKISPQCSLVVDIDELTLDHKYSRSRRPDLLLSSDNLAPCCASCNSLKGSRNIEDLIEQYPHLADQ